jgi:Glycosyl transferase 4-like domain
MLAVVSHFKWVHINYLKALGEHFDVLVAWSGESGRGAAGDAMREGLRAVPIGRPREDGAATVRARLAAALERWRPDVVHVMYYDNEELTVLSRELAGDDVPVVFECRDPLTTLRQAEPGSPHWDRERDALVASEAHIFISRALRAYYERAHGLDLAATSLIAPHSFARNTVAPPSPKLSARDGRVHIALIGTATDDPGHVRWYGEIIPRLVSLGLVVHSHFFEIEGISLEPYRQLARELEDYHHHHWVSHWRDAQLSQLISRYDLMGVFYEMSNATERDFATQELGMPSKSVSAWLHAGAPTISFARCQGIIERVDDLGVGFLVDSWDEVGRIAADREAIAAATERCLATRDLFTTEHNAARIAALVANARVALGRSASS